jgi:hypothetical protein
MKGGKRPGAGRKPLHAVKMRARQILLDAASDARALELGNGNRSAGVRIALASPVPSANVPFPISLHVPPA